MSTIDNHVPRRGKDGVDVVLLDPDTDAPTGTMDKLEAHRQGRYHAALSVILLTSSGSQILQRRAAGKYHGGGLWANACCSHPLPGEHVAAAAKRRLGQEMGIATPLWRLGTIRYRARVPGAAEAGPSAGLIENEHVTLFVAHHDGALAPDPAEVGETATVRGPIYRAPGATAPWFELYMREFGTNLVRLAREAGRPGFTPVDLGRFDLIEDGL